MLLGTPNTGVKKNVSNATLSLRQRCSQNLQQEAANYILSDEGLVFETIYFLPPQDGKRFYKHSQLMKLNFCFSLSLTPRPSSLVFFMRKHTLFEPRMEYSERVNAPLRALIVCILSARKTTFKVPRLFMRFFIPISHLFQMIDAITHGKR